MKLKVVPLSLALANEFVEQHHRHHKPAVGHRFSVGCQDEDGVLHGAAIIGRPVARLVNYNEVLEVSRCVTDGTKNACSFLYGASARIGKELGYKSIQTYILETETGVTLKASGWTNVGTCGGGAWVHTKGKPRRTDQPMGKKLKWIKVLNP